MLVLIGVLAVAVLVIAAFWEEIGQLADPDPEDRAEEARGLLILREWAEDDPSSDSTGDGPDDYP